MIVFIMYEYRKYGLIRYCTTKCTLGSMHGWRIKAMRYADAKDSEAATAQRNKRYRQPYYIPGR